jgi:hypothetical protein
LGVSAEKVVATIEIPKSHQGIFLPDKKNSFELVPAFLDTLMPMSKKMAKNEMIMIQSNEAKCIIMFS